MREGEGRHLGEEDDVAEGDELGVELAERRVGSGEVRLEIRLLPREGELCAQLAEKRRLRGHGRAPLGWRHAVPIWKEGASHSKGWGQVGQNARVGETRTSPVPRSIVRSKRKMWWSDAVAEEAERK